MKLMTAIAAVCLAQVAQSATPEHVNGLGGWLSNTTFAYSAEPDGSPSTLQFASGAMGLAVIGAGFGPDVDGKIASLSVSATADMSSVGASVTGSKFYQSFAAQGKVDISMLDGLSGNLLSATISGGLVQVDVVTHRATVELNLVGLTSGSLYLTGQPATLSLDGMLATAPMLGNCSDHAYKATCLPGEQFLDDFMLTSNSTAGSWKISTGAFVSAVPEPGTAALMLLGTLALSWLAAGRSAAKARN
ncbi:PEP-CTERM sorting domain-containing protein [Roseateles sp. BYS78W]|uniref:PEP-CTERM sorting domain-containing protein n=1 Tax=Pelomonas candidula TaxID=3299025 RepID=A0ABW7HE59_9BURK